MVFEKSAVIRMKKRVKNKIFHMQNGEIYEFNCSGR